jgi:uncharacterized Rmd1/YagE family protein
MVHEQAAPPPSEADALGALAGARGFTAYAVAVGERIELRRYPPARRLAGTPLTVGLAGGGVAVLFHYGVVVFFGGEEGAREALLADVGPFVHASRTLRETEYVDVRVDPHAQEGMEGGVVVIRHLDVERLQIVAHNLATSVILAVQEEAVGTAMQRIEPFARQLWQSGRPGRGSRELLRAIGESLLSEHQMVGRVAVVDAPEVIWERPELEGLHVRLAQEFEIRERHGALEQKLDLISRTARTLIDLLYNRRSLRVEWYIVLLILFEIMITLFERFVP